MKKEQKVALALAGLLVLNTLPGCGNQNENNTDKNETTVTEEVKKYRVKDLYVVLSKTMTGKTVPYIVTKYTDLFNVYYYEIFTNSHMINSQLQNINDRYVSVQLLNYLNSEEMSEYVSVDEIRSIYSRLQNELSSSEEERLKLTNSNIENTEKTYNIEKLMISEIQKKSDKEKELFIIDRYGREIFTNISLSYNINYSYNIISFIELENYKEEYTESELKEILEYARTKYHDMNNENTLELTK